MKTKIHKSNKEIMLFKSITKTGNLSFAMSWASTLARYDHNKLFSILLRMMSSKGAIENNKLQNGLIVSNSISSFSRY